MRGHNIVKPNKDEANRISQSFQSYHSKTQFFADLITSVADFGQDYNPLNPKLSISFLKTLYDNAVEANKVVVYSYTQFTLINRKRIEAYSNLSYDVMRVKESIKAQYGTQSVECRILKGLYV